MRQRPVLRIRLDRVPARRPLALVAMLVTIVVAMTSCGSGNGAHTQLTLYNDKGAWSPYFTQIGRQAQKQIGLSVDPVGYTDEATYYALVRASFRTRHKPDMFTWATGPQLDQIAEAGAVADTSDLWRRGIADGTLTRQIEKYYTVDGKQYCVPLNVSYWVMYYNKKLFADNGLHPPKTWHDLMSAAGTLKSAGVTPFYQTSMLFSFVWFQQLLIGTDPGLYTRLVNGTAKYTDPGVVQVMKLWKHMIDKGYLSNPGDKTEPAAMLKSGKVAMVPNGTFYNATMKQNGLKSGKDYGTFIVPNVNPSVKSTGLAFESGPLCTLASSPNKANNDRFLRWWVGDDAQSTWANSRGDVSANPNVKISDPRLNSINQKVTTPKAGYRIYNRYYDAVPPDVQTAALDAFGAFMVDPGSYRTQLAHIEKTAADARAKEGK